jgi:hypothetical protein
MSPISPFPQKPSAAQQASATAKLVAEGVAPPPHPAAAPAPAPTPAPAAVTLPAQKIPLMCTMCGNQLSAVYTAATKTFTHVHQEAGNAPKCPVTGKKFRINASHDVEEVSA